MQTIKITPENEHLLKSGYEARTEKELPVMPDLGYYFLLVVFKGFEEIFPP